VKPNALGCADMGEKVDEAKVCERMGTGESKDPTDTGRTSPEGGNGPPAVGGANAVGDGEDMPTEEAVALPAATA
jgi:hypothetical protein